MPRKVPPSKAALGLFTPGYRNKWLDPEWTEGLSRTAKGLFHQITENPSISRAGTLQIDAQSLADQHPDCQVDEIEKDLGELREKGYVTQDGPWLFVTSWFRTERNTRNINHLKPIMKDIESVGRKDLRRIVIRALFTSLSEAAGDGEQLTQDLVNACTEFAQKWSEELPPQITHTPRAARKKSTQMSF